MAGPRVIAHCIRYHVMSMTYMWYNYAKYDGLSNLCATFGRGAPVVRYLIARYNVSAMDSGYRLLAARYIRRQAKQLAEQFDGIRAAEDIEFVHRARVATRRLRAALRMFPAVSPARSFGGGGRPFAELRPSWVTPGTGTCRSSFSADPLGLGREGLLSGHIADPGSIGARSRAPAAQSGQGGGPP